MATQAEKDAAAAAEAEAATLAALEQAEQELAEELTKTVGRVYPSASQLEAMSDADFLAEIIETRSQQRVARAEKAQHTVYKQRVLKEMLRRKAARAAAAADATGNGAS